MIDTKAIRAKVLDLAIRGKLTEQLPEDGTAADLYVRIQEEKQALIAAGKIKREKALPEIAEEEKPFEIPQAWMWVRLGDVCTNIQYGSSQKSSPTGKIPVIRMGNLQAGRIVYDKLVYTSDDVEIARYPLQKDDLLFNRTNSIELVGKTAIYKAEMPAIYAGYLVRITPLIMVSDLLNYMMQTQHYWSYCSSVRSDANGQSNINAEKLKRFSFPLPPLPEQHRIVAIVDQIFSLLDTIDTLLARYTQDTAALKAKLIEAGIRGQLTERLPGDGTAEELYAQIQAEKQALIAAGKIKREKPLLEITDEEKPFEIPEGWMWVRLGDYVEKVTDQVASGSFAALRDNVVSKKTPDYAILVKTADFSNGFTKNLTYTDKHGYDFLANSNLFGGELILSNVGSIGKCFIVPALEHKMTLAPNAVMIRLMKEEHRDYLYYYIVSTYGQSALLSITTGVAMLKFNKTDLKTILIPLPPLPEQRRIVARLEELMAVCEG